MSKLKKTVIYVDGFNLYYGCLKGTPYRWLDLLKLAQLLLPTHDILQIKYFTALVTSRLANPDQATRQQTYLRALQTIPNLQIIYGHFLSHEIMMPLAPPRTGYAKIIKTEEKGSDVNIAVHLISDAFRDAFDAAVIVSNDSDLLPPIKFVKEELGKLVGILNPQKHPSVVLAATAHFVKNIRPNVLINSQFPATLSDAKGNFTKPANW
jgi:uncharacterized LabA/DUF88 family protein